MGFGSIKNIFSRTSPTPPDANAVKQARARFDTAKTKLAHAKEEYENYQYGADPWGETDEGRKLHDDVRSAEKEVKAAKSNLKKLDPSGYAAEKKAHAKPAPEPSYGSSTQDSFGHGTRNTRNRTSGSGPQAPPPRNASGTPTGTPRAGGIRGAAPAAGAAGSVPVSQALGVIFASKDPAQRAQALATVNLAALQEAAASPAGALRKNPSLAAVLRQAISTPGTYRRALASIHPDKFSAQFKENQGHLAGLFGATPQVANEKFTERLTLVRTLLDGAKNAERPAWVS